MQNPKSEFLNLCQTLWQFLNRPVFRGRANPSKPALAISNWWYRADIQLLEFCWQLDLTAKNPKVQLLERCWQQDYPSEQQC